MYFSLLFSFSDISVSALIMLILFMSSVEMRPSNMDLGSSHLFLSFIEFLRDACHRRFPFLILSDICFTVFEFGVLKVRLRQEKNKKQKTKYDRIRKHHLAADAKLLLYSEIEIFPPRRDNDDLFFH